MNILFINRYVFLKHGGGEVNDVNLCREFVKLGHDVSILTQLSNSVDDATVLENLENFGAKVINVQSPYMYNVSWKFGKVFGKLIRIFDELLFYLKAKNQIREDYDISFTTGRPISWLILQKKCKVNIYSARGRLTRLLQNQLSRYSKTLFWGHCEQDNNELNLARLDYLSLPPAIDKEKFIQRGGKLTIGSARKMIRKLAFFGRLEPIKNLDFLIQAMARLKHENYELHIYGSGSQSSLLKEKVVALDLTDAIFFHGKVTNSDVGAAMSNVDCIVLCSHRENYPIVLLEAVYSGNRVLAPNIGRINEIITNTKSGYTYANGNMDHFLEQLSKLRAVSIEDFQYGYINDWSETATNVMSFATELTND